MKMKGRFHVEHVRAGEVIGKYEMPNGIVDVGLNKILDVMFHAATQITTWYISLVDNDGFSAFNAADQMSSHAGWTESNGTGSKAGYSDSTRVEWTEGAAASKSITNATPITFNINVGGVIKGIFVTSASDKGGTTGTLWSTAAFATNVTVVNGDQLKVTYTVNASEV